MKKSLVIVSAMLFALFAIAQADSDKDVTDKAEFIINLIDNVQWSEDGKPGELDEAVIYVLGECPVYSKLEELAEKASEKGRKIKVELVSHDDDLSGGHILFLPSDDLTVLAKVLKKIDGSKTITVADAKDFARYGAMISLYAEDGDSDIHYEINRLVVESAGITLNSKLMDKAELI
jgi:hypothetical protein